MRLQIAAAAGGATQGRERRRAFVGGYGNLEDDSFIFRAVALSEAHPNLK